MKWLVVPFVILGVLASACSSTGASSSVAHTSRPTQENVRQTFVVDCKTLNWYSSAESCAKVSNCLAARLPDGRFTEANNAILTRTSITVDTSRIMAICKAQGFTRSVEREFPDPAKESPIGLVCDADVDSEILALVG
jgi:hypothetical protein